MIWPKQYPWSLYYHTDSGDIALTGGGIHIMATARKLPSGNWRVRIPAEKDENGKWRYKSFTAETKKDAEYLANEFSRSSKAARSYRDMLLKDAYTRYIAARKGVISPNTIIDYEKKARNDFKELMAEKLKDITQEKIQRAVSKMAQTHAPKTVLNSHGLLSAVLKTYKPDMRLRTTLPQKGRADLYIPTDEEIALIKNRVTGRSLEIPFLLSAFGPLRRSEICALTPNDIIGNAIDINKAYTKTPEKTWEIKVPKSPNGYRTIEFPEFVIDKIKEKIEKNGIGPDERICGVVPDTITNYWGRTRAKLEINQTMRFHDLRHYAASRMHAMLIPDKYICKRGGWDEESYKRIYKAIIKDQDIKFNAHINEEFSKIYAMIYDTDMKKSFV